MTTSLVGLFIFLIVAFVLSLLLVVGVFVFMGVYRMSRARASAANAITLVAVSDGLDATELVILRDHFAKRKAATTEAALKAKLADFAKP